MNEELKTKMSEAFQGTASRLAATDPEWVEIVSNFSQDEAVSASKLTEKERMLCILSTLLGCQGMGEFRHMVHAALNGGLEPEAIREVIYQATAYLGIGRVYDFLEAASQIMEQHGIRLPLENQGTTGPKDRFEKGLAKQVELFGEGMAKRQTEGPLLRRNINRWLAANCFGDYYTRKGLNDQEREMITFCFLLAQGGCENQLRGHTAGNFGVGNGKEKMYSVVEQCMPYIGYPRSLNAMSIIDEVAAKMEA
ncbi:MAG TPA: carboxymuconolactone decarboxylase family protein [Candidatus Pullilachnospira stercoravium]|uniref:Carboxymuconolactone decarboxylase family protein n=1 Tax=Candidatus Pullilachnospira stercoravium TaxID=2840913 RepID=A0A9D1T5K9_9FIRM|nr:carboxymuconolactone decarboxylase family protein [Candidatus Pullilachnospira stercoravium]